MLGFKTTAMVQAWRYLSYNVELFQSSTGGGGFLSNKKRRLKEAPFPFKANIALDFLQIASRSFAAVVHDLKTDFLAFDQRRQASLLNSGRMNENVLAAIIRLNKAIAFLAVEPFYSASRHLSSPLT